MLLRLPYPVRPICSSGMGGVDQSPVGAPELCVQLLGQGKINRVVDSRMLDGSCPLEGALAKQGIQRHPVDFEREYIFHNVARPGRRNLPAIDMLAQDRNDLGQPPFRSIEVATFLRPAKEKILRPPPAPGGEGALLRQSWRQRRCSWRLSIAASNSLSRSSRIRWMSSTASISIGLPPRSRKMA